MKLVILPKEIREPEIELKDVLVAKGIIVKHKESNSFVGIVTYDGIIYRIFGFNSSTIATNGSLEQLIENNLDKYKFYQL